MQPHRIKIGSAVILVSLDGLAVDWGIPEEGIVKLLAIFAIPILTLPGGDKRYISLWPLEMALFEAGLPVACKGSQPAIRAIHASAGIVYGTLTKEVIRERLSRLQQDLARTGPHTSAKRKKPGSGKKTRSRKI